MVWPSSALLSRLSLQHDGCIHLPETRELSFRLVAVHSCFLAGARPPLESARTSEADRRYTFTHGRPKHCQHGLRGLYQEGRATNSQEVGFSCFLILFSLSLSLSPSLFIGDCPLLHIYIYICTCVCTDTLTYGTSKPTPKLIMYCIRNHREVCHLYTFGVRIISLSFP